MMMDTITSNTSDHRSPHLFLFCVSDKTLIFHTKFEFFQVSNFEIKRLCEKKKKKGISGAGGGFKKCFAKRKEKRNRKR